MAPLILAQIAVVAAGSSGVADPAVGPSIGLTVDACVDADRKEFVVSWSRVPRALADPDRKRPDASHAYGVPKTETKFGCWSRDG